MNKAVVDKSTGRILYFSKGTDGSHPCDADERVKAGTAVSVEIPEPDGQGRYPMNVIQRVSREDVLETGIKVGARIVKRFEVLRLGPSVVIEAAETEAFMEGEDPAWPTEATPWSFPDTRIELNPDSTVKTIREMTAGEKASRDADRAEEKRLADRTERLKKMAEGQGFDTLRNSLVAANDTEGVGILDALKDDDPTLGDT